MPRDIDGYNNLTLLGKILFFIRYIPGITVLLYAYLFIIGYFYLSSYFSKWDLSTIEIGFSITDYATVAMFPILTISFFAIGTFGLGYLIANNLYKISNEPPPRKQSIFRRVIFFIIYLALPLGFLIPIVIRIIKSKSISSWSNLVFVIGLFFYFYGMVIHLNKSKTKLLTSMSLIILLGLPFCSSYVGEEYANIYRAFSFYPLRFPKQISGVVIYSSSPLKGLEVFQTEDNKYEGLMLLAFKNDTYYFAVSLLKTNDIYRQIGQKQKKLNDTLNDLNRDLSETSLQLKKTALNNSEKRMTAIDKEITSLKNSNVPDLVKDNKIAELRARLAMESQVLIENQNITASAKERLDLLTKRLEENKIESKKINEQVDAISTIKNSAISIKKEKISHLIYLEEMDIDKSTHSVRLFDFEQFSRGG